MSIFPRFHKYLPEIFLKITNLCVFLTDLKLLSRKCSQDHEFLSIFARSHQYLLGIFLRISNLCVVLQISEISCRNSSQDHEFVCVFSRSHEHPLEFVSPDHESVSIFTRSHKYLPGIFLKITNLRVFLPDLKIFSGNFSQDHESVYFCRSLLSSQDHKYVCSFARSHEYLLEFFSQDHASVYLFARFYQSLHGIFLRITNLCIFLQIS